PDCVRTVIYLVRHPFDVAVSLAYHMNTTPEHTVQIMADDGSVRRPYRTLVKSLQQTFGSWSGNVESWLNNPAYRVSWSRYEDVCAGPVEHIERHARAAGLSVSREDVVAAVKASDFQELQREEKRAGFREKAKESRLFFRTGRPGTWKGVLDESLRARLVRDHGRVMERLGYGVDGETGPLPILQ
ncbi:MAG TPA: sulfotransferase domain-containing protein, partial [Rhizomicrobium sp.]|nr:sulfotransferase domain-containing protein [Rhizomicrobium sp.]